MAIQKRRRVGRVFTNSMSHHLLRRQHLRHTLLHQLPQRLNRRAARIFAP